MDCLLTFERELIARTIHFKGGHRYFLFFNMSLWPMDPKKLLNHYLTVLSWIAWFKFWRTVAWLQAFQAHSLFHIQRTKSVTDGAGTDVLLDVQNQFLDCVHFNHFHNWTFWVNSLQGTFTFIFSSCSELMVQLLPH